MKRIRKGDRVIVTAGREKGRQGTVIRVLEDDHVVVENVKKGDRVGFKTLDDGRKVRVFRSNGEVVDV
jgi:large subunit ribosomal protein L24